MEHPLIHVQYYFCIGKFGCLHEINVIDLLTGFEFSDIPEYTARNC